MENSGGANKDKGTTFWSLKKAFEDAYYDREIDRSSEDEGCGRTVRLISEVPVTEELTLAGADENNLKKRTLDVNSFDVQVANNSSEGGYTDGFTLRNAWLTLEDMSNTTGAELAIGNNARFVIDSGAKLIIDQTCQLEIEWDGATTTVPADGQPAQPAQPDVLNNGILDLRAGGEVVNNGIITIEGFEGKPYQPAAGEQAVDSEKGCGELTVNPGATLTNNGCLVVNGKLFNLGTLVNNGKYDDVIESNDPDKGVFAYHKGIQVGWKDDVTQKNVYPGTLTNGQDRNGTTYQNALLLNNGDILLVPGTLDNYGILINSSGAHIYQAAATEAIIPIEPLPENPLITYKRVTLDPPQGSVFNNYGILINNGRIEPASVELLDNQGLGTLTTPGDHPEMFAFNNYGRLENNGFIFVYIPPRNNGDEEHSNNSEQVQTSVTDGRIPVMILFPDGILTIDGGVAVSPLMYIFSDGSCEIRFSDGTVITGVFRIIDGELVLVLKDGTVIRPIKDRAGNHIYRFSKEDGSTVTYILSPEQVRIQKALLSA